MCLSTKLIHLGAGTAESISVLTSIDNDLFQTSVYRRLYILDGIDTWTLHASVPNAAKRTHFTYEYK